MNSQKIHYSIIQTYTLNNNNTKRLAPLKLLILCIPYKLHVIQTTTLLILYIPLSGTIHKEITDTIHPTEITSTVHPFLDVIHYLSNPTCKLHIFKCNIKLHTFSFCFQILCVLHQEQPRVEKVCHMWNATKPK